MRRVMSITLFLLFAALPALAQPASSLSAGDPALLQPLFADPSIQPLLQRGLALDIDAPNTALALQLANMSGIRIHHIVADASKAGPARAAIEAAGLSALRIRVEAGPLEALAYPNLAFNVAFCSLPPENPVVLKELCRLVHPGGWVFILSGSLKVTVDEVQRRYADTHPGTWLTPRAIGGFIAMQRAPREGAAEWTHYYRDPDNNRYSPDKLLRPPLRILWYGEPRFPLGDLYYTQALTAGGRLFMTDAFPDDTTRARLTCLDAYNGFKLWERSAGGSRFTKVDGTKADGGARAFQMPGWVLPGQMAVSATRLYLTDGPDCLVMDSATGRDLARFKAPPPTHPSNCWRFVAYQGDLLFGCADAPSVMPGTKPPLPVLQGGPATLFALNLTSGVPAWVREGSTNNELGATFGPPLAIGGERIFLRASFTNLVAIDTKSGATAWKANVPEDPAKDTWWEGVAHRDHFILSKYTIRTWNAKKKLATATYTIADGKLVSEVTTNLEKEIFWNSSEAFLGSPPTPRLGCNYGSAAGPFYFHRNNYLMEKTNAVPGGPTTQLSYGGVRAACGVGVLPANGLAHVLPNGLGCGCAAYHATLAMEPGLPVETFAADKNPAPEELAQLPADQERPATPLDWPTYMADAQRSGITPQDLSKPHAYAWEVRVSGDPTPCIAVGKQVFLGATDEAVYALDAANGRILWKLYTGGPIRTAPAYWNGRIYAGSEDGCLYCLDAAKGEIIWRLRAGPSARQQVAFETLISAWPLRHGIALEDGRLYFSAGFMPGNEIYACAADARTGTIGWRIPLGRSSIIPCGYLVLKSKAVMYPSPGSASIYHPIFLSRADGSRQGGGNTHGDFTECRFVPGLETDEADYRRGFLLYGGSTGVQRGYRNGVGYCGRASRHANNYGMMPEPPDTPSTKQQGHGQIGDGASFLPVFTSADVFLRVKGAVVRVARSDIMKYSDTRLQKGTERDAFHKWQAKDLPCGEPEWLLAATGTKDGDPVTLLAGGPKGIAALDAADGKVLWSVEGDSPTLPAAIAGGRIFATTRDGRVRSLR